MLEKQKKAIELRKKIMKPKLELTGVSEHARKMAKIKSQIRESNFNIILNYTDMLLRHDDEFLTNKRRNFNRHVNLCRKQNELIKILKEQGRLIKLDENDKQFKNRAPIVPPLPNLSDNPSLLDNQRKLTSVYKKKLNEFDMDFPVADSSSKRE